MISTVVLQPDGTIQIPPELAQSQGWLVGQKLSVIAKGRSLQIVAVPTRDELRGIAKGADTSDTRDRNDRY